MKLKAVIIMLPIIVLASAVSFYLGVNHRTHPDQIAYDALMANYKNVGEEFGCADDKSKVIHTITVFKTDAFAVIEENGVKTIRVYDCPVE